MNAPTPAIFENLEPIERPPSLTTVNGIGTSVYGHRDHDPATATYVKTHFIVFFFLPIVALSAYRVADAPGGGWYFLGRVPLSAWTRNFNFLMLGLAIGTAVSAALLG